MEQLLIESVKTAGPVVVLIVFFVWRDFKREQCMSQRAREVEDFIKEKLLTALQQTTEAVTKNTEILAATREALFVLNHLPCVSEDFRRMLCEYAKDQRNG